VVAALGAALDHIPRRRRRWGQRADARQAWAEGGLSFRTARVAPSPEHALVPTLGAGPGHYLGGRRFSWRTSNTSISSAPTCKRYRSR
jgi:hypothetical protein